MGSLSHIPTPAVRRNTLHVMNLKSVVIFLCGAITGLCQPAPMRPPAVPLVAHDPYFSIWSMAVLAEDGQLAPTQAWDTITVDLEWTNGDWKITSDGTSPGPVPALTQSGPQTKQLPTQLRDYQSYNYATGP